MDRVLADDFSGAAEIAGVGFRHGLSSAVQLDSTAVPSDDLAVLDLDSRSCRPDEAGRRVRSIVELGDWSFKKIDSVLRGNVLAEIGPLLQSGDRRRALVVPFNPDLGRAIEGGRYLINRVPINETPFRDDPEYPALSSQVTEILREGAPAGVVRVCRLCDALPDRGIIVGEGSTTEDLDAWASRLDAGTLPVGGAPFFSAWLESRGRRKAAARSAEGGPTVLVVSGTTARVVDWTKGREGASVAVLPMPVGAFERGLAESVAEWADQVAGALERSGFAVASIGSARLLDRTHASRLTGHLAELAAQVLGRVLVDQLWLEGGATASAVVRRLGWASLAVVGELAPGVVQLRPAAGGPLVIVKPGSYPLARPVSRASA